MAADNTTHNNVISAYFETSSESQLLPFHFHHDHELIFVTGGQAVFTLDGRSYLLDPGSLLAIGGLEKHELKITGFPYQRYVLSVSSDFLMQAIKVPELLSLFVLRPAGFQHKIQLSVPLSDRIKQIFDLMITEVSGKQSFWEWKSAGLLLDILIALYRQNPGSFPSRSSSPHMELLLSVQRYLQEHYREFVSLEQTAAAHFVSKYHLSRIFFETSGYHFKEYLIRLRLNEAKRLLIMTDLPVTMVGSECGYLDVNHFIRIFRTQEGMAPLQYRKKNKK